MPTTLAERLVTQRLAMLLPIREMISSWAKIHELADAIYQRYPRAVKDGINLKPRGTFQADAATFTAALPAEEREERRDGLDLLCDTVDRLIAEVNGEGEGAAFTEEDLDLILFATELIAKFGSVSKRDVGRFREAIAAGDAAYLIVQHLPPATKLSRRQKIEAKFTHELPAETLEALRLKQR